jgi:nucleoside-diphosphate-sugar epimerase
VTGGAGFVGSHLVDRLVKRGEHVVVLDNLTTGRLANLADAIASGRVTFVYADVATTTATIRDILERAGVPDRLESIYHLASPATSSAYEAQPWETLPVTLSLIDIAFERGAKFIFSSTAEIYGDPLVHPQPESYFGNVDPVGPRSCCDEGERCGEAAVTAAVRTRSLDARIVRFFNCYGPRMQDADDRLIPSLLDALRDRRPLPIHGSGQQTRSMTYIADAIDCLLLVAATNIETLEPTNIGCDDERTILDIAAALAAVLSVDLVVEHVAGREGDPQRRHLDLTRARRLGWTARTSLEQGLRLTHDWYAKESQIFV